MNKKNGWNKWFDYSTTRIGNKIISTVHVKSVTF